MPNVKGLLTDPQFNALDMPSQKSVLAGIDPQFGSLSDSDFATFKQSFAPSSGQALPQPTWMDRIGNAVGVQNILQGVDAFGNSIRDLGDSRQSWPNRLGNVVSNIPFVGPPLAESAHALARLSGAEPQATEGPQLEHWGSTMRDALRAVPGGSIIQQPFEDMANGRGIEGLSEAAMLAMGLYGRGGARYGEPIQPVEEGAQNIWNPKTKQFEPNVAPGLPGIHPVIKKAAEWALPVPPAVQHLAVHGYESLRGKTARPVPPPMRMMNVTPFNLGAPEPPSVIPEWQPPQLPPSDLGIPATETPRGAIPGGPQNIPPAPGEPGGPAPPSLKRSDVLPVWANVRDQQMVPPVPVESIPATATPRGAVPGGAWNIPAPQPAPTRWTPPPEYQAILPAPLTPPAPVEPIPAIATPRGAVPGGIQNQTEAVPPPRIIGSGARFEPSPAPDLSPVQPIPATATPRGSSVPSVEERIARASSPSVTPKESLQNVKEFTGKLKRGTKSQTFVQPNTPVVVPSASQANTPAFANPLEGAVTPTPLTPLPATPAAQPSGLLQNLTKTVQESADTNAEKIAEHAGTIGHTLTTNKNAVMAQHLLGNQIDADKWAAMPMDEKQAWVKKINAARKQKYKPFGADFRPGGYGRPAEEGARQVEDALRVLGAQSPQ